MTISLRPRELQALLIDNGFNCGPHGADGVWGPGTARACSVWFSSGRALVEPSTAGDPNRDLVQRPAASLVPLEWMPDCDMDRIITHWTAGAYTPSEHDLRFYHILIDGNGMLHRGSHSIKDNVSTRDRGGYAAHTRNANSGSIGVAVCAMAGAKERPFYAGTAPMTELQFTTLAQVTAELAKKYGIKVSPTTVLSHAEVERTLGIEQAGKWDIDKLPWEPKLTPAKVHIRFREEVRRFLADA